VGRRALPLEEGPLGHGHDPELLGQGVVGDGLPAPGQPLVDPLQVGAGVGPTERPRAVRKWAISRVVEVLPFVPVTWIRG